MEIVAQIYVKKGEVRWSEESRWYMTEFMEFAQTSSKLEQMLDDHKNQELFYQFLDMQNNRFKMKQQMELDRPILRSVKM